MPEEIIYVAAGGTDDINSTNNSTNARYQDPFEMFDKGSVDYLTTASDKMKTGISTTYTIVNRIAIFCMVVALILAGITIIVQSGNARDTAQNKTMLVRILGASAGIFCAVGIISLLLKTTL